MMSDGHGESPLMVQEPTNSCPTVVPPENQANLPETVIEPESGWLALNVRELWEYRALLLVLVWRDIKAYHKQTVLGAAWAVLKPLLMVGIFTAVLGGRVTSQDNALPYPLFVYAGVLPWFFFAGAVSNAANSLVAAEQLISKIYFPRLIVPIATVLGGLLDLGIGFIGLILLMCWYGVRLTEMVLFLPLVFVLFLGAGIGVGTLLAALNVRYRDVRHLVPFLLQAWLFATPAIYIQSDAASAVPAAPGLLSWLGGLNPMNALIASFRATILGGAIPWSGLGISALLILLCCIGGCYYFRRVEGTFADII